MSGATTTWTATREQLVHELARTRAEGAAAATALAATRAEVQRLKEERDGLRRDLLDTKGSRGALEAELVELRNLYDRLSSMASVREVEVSVAVNSLSHALASLSRPLLIPNREAAANQRRLTAALKEKIA